ncbi:riboflavin synthase subunit alpha [Ureibacillus massiliensis 4400831 = CIP 108448 = CCUG 49529]|uniref:Riboflavin synthase n=1 Tax=Ureibacillus massiliensis 4400831 = CIP 108448 = CCUG 49529 TaxID=1211035 RepID=A0A0A3IZ38_9BACL|nr:riboflavin synthase [Ureibacillus massiliensis]KGR89966.1 riboflavin synthase subunit alpha [Ureibacillus massiliensis 4400831 = CIP 108448 = CCUG 49529]
MFTGIIEELGRVTALKKDDVSMELSLQCSKILSDANLGDSVSVNGVCLTITNFTKNEMTVDVMPETVKATNIHKLKIGDYVNLERAMLANGRFGGHIVAGHVDGVGIIRSIKPVANAVYIEIEAPKELTENCIPKGSITVDGTSLTLFKVSEKSLTISLIPHTFKETVLGIKKVGDQVNIETDLLGKYVLHHLGNIDKKSNITIDFLRKNGF